MNYGADLKPKTVPTGEACKYLGIGKTTLYQLIKDKKLKLLKLGGKSLVLISELDDLIDSLAKEAA